LTVRLGAIGLRLEMAVCWKLSWNVDPLPLSVPLRAAMLGDELLADGLLPAEEDEELVEVPLPGFGEFVARRRLTARRLASALAPTMPE
jgi:hypothetical protein